MGTLDALIGSAFGTIFGTGYVLGAAIFIFFAYVAFKSGVPTSGLMFLAMLLLGTMFVLSYVNALVYGAALVVGAWFVYRAFLAVSG